MTASLLPGRPVSTAECAAPLPRVLLVPETAQEHVRNAWQLLQMVLRDESGVVHIAGPDYDAAMARLQQAVAQLEGRVA